MKKSIQEIEKTAISEIVLQIAEFIDLYTARIINDKIGALDAIENDWTALRVATERVYQQMIGELINSVDEREMIAKKKQNGANGESKLKPIKLMKYPGFDTCNPTKGVNKGKYHRDTPLLSLQAYF